MEQRNLLKNFQVKIRDCGDWTNFWICYNLRPRGHGLTLSVIPSEFMRKNFLNRMLYNDIY